MTLKNEMVHMKKCSKKSTINLKKNEIINLLCGMGEEAIIVRLGQLSNTTVLQLDSSAIFQLGSARNGGGYSNK